MRGHGETSARSGRLRGRTRRALTTASSVTGGARPCHPGSPDGWTGCTRSTSASKFRRFWAIPVRSPTARRSATPAVGVEGGLRLLVAGQQRVPGSAYGCERSPRERRRLLAVQRRLARRRGLHRCIGIHGKRLRLCRFGRRQCRLSAGLAGTMIKFWNESGTNRRRIADSLPFSFCTPPYIVSR